jgi:hypothetical protein
MNPRLEKLPKWKGFPVPFFVTWRVDNIPDFKVVNEANRVRCAKENLCWICGERLDYWIFFIGGPHACAHGLFVDGPMHRECANDAMAICPFLIGTMDYATHFDMSKIPHEVRFTGGETRAVSQIPPEKVGLLRTRGFDILLVQHPRDPKAATWFFKVKNVSEITWRDRVQTQAR